MVGFVPGASSCQAFDPFGPVAASESAMAVAGATADRRKLDRSGPIAAAVWQLAPGSGDSYL